VEIAIPDADGVHRERSDRRFMVRPDRSYHFGRTAMPRTLVPIRDGSGAIVAVDYTVGDLDTVRMRRVD
jgi:hypothetical protein